MLKKRTAEANEPTAKTWKPITVTLRKPIYEALEKYVKSQPPDIGSMSAYAAHFIREGMIANKIITRDINNF